MKPTFSNWARLARLSITLCSVSLGACVQGTITDAVTQQPVQDAITYIFSGTCSGSGCDNPEYKDLPTSAIYGQQLLSTGAITTYVNSTAQGRFIFNGRSNSNQRLLALSDRHESLGIGIYKAGYHPVELFYVPGFIRNPLTARNARATLPTVYLCPVNSPDKDRDSLCDAAEQHYGTNPNRQDSDGDGLSDAAEIYGVSGIDLASLGANPNRKDIFVEIDYYPVYKPQQAALDKVVKAFADAPVDNPDGSKGINLHIVLDQAIAPEDIDANLSPVWDDVDTLKKRYFSSQRQGIFHYALFAELHNDDTFSGKSRGVPGTELVVTLGGFTPEGGSLMQQGGTLMHELGHNLGLEHGGYEQASRKVNYFSVMNYNYQISGLHVGNKTGVLDYSRVRVAPISEKNLNEQQAMQPLAPTTEAELARYKVRDRYEWFVGNASENLDFNRNSLIETRVRADINSNGFDDDDFNSAQIDWDKLRFAGGKLVMTQREQQLAGSSPRPILHPLVQHTHDADNCMKASDITR